MKYNDLLNELMNLLDKNEDIIKVRKLKKNLLQNSIFLNQIKCFQEEKSLKIKEELLKNNDYREYLNCETNISFMIMEIKKKMNLLDTRKCIK